MESREPEMKRATEEAASAREAALRSRNAEDDARADDGGWRKAEMALLGSLSTALSIKKIEELAETDRNREKTRDLEDEEWLGADADADAKQVFQFRKAWIAQWFGAYGSFHDITIIDPMRFTYHTAPPCARPCNTLQVYSVKVAAIAGDFEWPLDVFGMVAVRDSVDRNRNLLFYRARDTCQTLTQKDQCLVLSGPSRAVVLEDPVTIEVDLKVKGATESKDTNLSLLAVPLAYSGGSGLCPGFKYTSKHCTLEFMLGEIVSSVEAAIFIRVIDGSWPDGFHGQFAARTTSVDHENVILLEFGHDHVVPVLSADSIMRLSRHVVSVEVSGTLKVSFRAWQDGCKAVEGEVAFRPAKAGRSYGTLHFGSCKMEVVVAWSLISPEPEPDDYGCIGNVI